MSLVTECILTSVGVLLGAMVGVVCAVGLMALVKFLGELVRGEHTKKGRAYRKELEKTDHTIGEMYLDTTK